MHLAVPVIAFALAALPNALATNHTRCYNYFMNKDHCVWSAADNRHRCDEQGKPPKKPVHIFEPPKHSHHKRDLERRYTSSGDDTTFAIDGGDGICGNYTTDQPGACLWTGSSDSGADPLTAGWLNGAKTSNCGKQLYVERVGFPDDPIYVPVVDGCKFFTKKDEVGCFQIALTNRSFYDLHPTPDEIANGYIMGGVIWDFNNEKGTKGLNAPV